LLSAEEIRELRREGKSIREIAEQEGVTRSAIQGRLERDERPWLDQARQERYQRNHGGYRPQYKKLSRLCKSRNQSKTIETASNWRQVWTLHEIDELEERVKKGQTILEIARAMNRTFRGVSRALHRFGISQRRAELTAAGTR